MQRAIFEVDDGFEGVADSFRQLEVARSATFAAPALQSFGADTPTLCELVFVQDPAVARCQASDRRVGDRGVLLTGVGM